MRKHLLTLCLVGTVEGLILGALKVPLAIQILIIFLLYPINARVHWVLWKEQWE